VIDFRQKNVRVARRGEVSALVRDVLPKAQDVSAAAQNVLQDLLDRATDLGNLLTAARNVSPLVEKRSGAGSRP